MSDPSAAPPLDLEAVLRCDLTDGMKMANHMDSLVVEVRRLRGLLERLRDGLLGIPPTDDCGGCIYCCAHPGDEEAGRPADEHEEACPWPELEAAVSAWRKP